MKGWSIVFMLFVAVGVEAQDFYGHWGDGKAELSSYRVVQPRYGELRQGYGVMIFVTEDIHRDTYIKVESPQPQEKCLYVLKLNNVLKFNTGIYDYSVMTSVFSEVEGGTEPFVLRKISLSAQEWCGHVFDEILLHERRIEGHLNSYFEAEGRRDYELEVPENFVSEDHLLIRMRELKGAFMATGEERQISLMPSLWSLRTAHVPHALVGAVLRKGGQEEVDVDGGRTQAVLWQIEREGQWRKWWVEVGYPRRILKWQDSDGGQGELLKTIRVPYWQLHANADEVYRGELGLPY